MLQPKNKIKLKETIPNTKIDNTKVNNSNPFTTLKKLNVRGKTDEEIAKERKDVRDKANSNPINKNFFNKDNQTRENWAESTAGLESKFRISDKPNTFDDYINPINMIGNMAAKLGSAPKDAKDSNSILPYITAVGAPLVTGALAGIGVKSTKQFINNIVNPLAGVKLNKLKQIPKQLLENYSKDLNEVFDKNLYSPLNNNKFDINKIKDKYNNLSELNRDKIFNIKEATRSAKEVLSDKPNAQKYLKSLDIPEGNQAVTSNSVNDGIKDSKHTIFEINNDDHFNNFNKTLDDVKKAGQIEAGDYISKNYKNLKGDINNISFNAYGGKLGNPPKDKFGNLVLSKIINNKNVNKSNYNSRTDVIELGTDYNNTNNKEKEDILTHENFHSKQNKEGRGNFDIAHHTDNEMWARMQKVPNIATTQEVYNNYNNRGIIENKIDYEDAINRKPEARLIPYDILYNKDLEQNRYNIPDSKEGEAVYYTNTGKDNYKNNLITNTKAMGGNVYSKNSRLPRVLKSGVTKKLGIGGLVAASSGIIGAVNPIAGIGVGVAGSLISSVEGQDEAQKAKEQMLVEYLKNKKSQDTQNNIGYQVNGNNDVNYYPYGGNINDEQELPLTPQQNRAVLQQLAQKRREDIIRKKDSIINRNLSATGLTIEQYRAKQVTDAKKKNVSLDGIQTSQCNKRTATNGSCTTGATMGGDSLKDVKAYGGNLEATPNISTTGKFNTTGGKLVPLSDNAEIAIGNTHESKQIDGQYGITLDDGQKPIAEIENKEVITDGEKVFSDRLKYDKNHTYASKMAKIATMSDKIQDKLNKSKDTKSKNGYTRMLEGYKESEDNLYAHQEVSKTKEDLKSLNKMAYGGGIPKYPNGNNDWLKGMIDSLGNGFRRTSNKGVNETPITNTTTPPTTIPENIDKPKTFKDYLTPNLIDNGVNAILTATTPGLAAPIKNVAERLKTDYNANPELATIKRDTTAIESNIMDNTSDSNVARANVAEARLNGMIAKNNVLGKKENTETSLINQDRMNTQGVNASNTALSNEFIDKSFTRANDIQSRISGNAANLSEDIKGAQTDVRMDKYYRQQLILDLQNDIGGSKARAYKNNATLMADPEIARMVNSTLQSRMFKPDSNITVKR